MNTRARAGWLGAVALVMGTLAAGCTDDLPERPAPTPPPSVEVTPTLTASPAGTAAPAPERPSSPSAPSAESASATARYFLELYPYAYASGDLTEWDRLAAPSCTYCSTTSDDVQRVVDSRHSVTGGAVEITEARADEVDPGTLYSAFLHYQEAPSQELDGAGAPVASSDGGTYTALIALRWTGAAWSVEAVDINGVA